MAHTTSIKVRGYHLDLYGHVNNARYLEFLEEARWAFFEENADLPHFMASGLALIIVNINISYRYPASMGDTLVIESGVKAIGNRSCVIHQEIHLDGKEVVVAEADVTMVGFDRKTNTAIVIDGELKDMLLALQAASA